MNYKIFLFIALSILSFTDGVGQEVPATAASAEINFDELEDLVQSANAFETAHFEKPTKLMVALQVVGTPLFNAYLKMTDGMAKLSAWWHTHEPRQ